ncbi:Outer membrane protein TolC [Halomonadaceae bacterium LMG 33818]|uniref:TolC family outer membrane protein n=1 Tax=Cernens ardua TaxID=3402176 RepID=UPI003EDCA154
MSTFRVLPLVLGLSLAPQLAHAADLISIAQDALSNNASLLSDRANLSATHAAQRVTLGQLLPQVSATAGVQRYRNYHSESSNALNGSYNENTVSVQATQTLFNATNWYKLKAAKRQTAQESLNFANSRQLLLFNVSKAYFQVLQAKELLDTYRAAEAAYHRQLIQTQQQFDVGVVAATDLREAEASYDSARAQRISQESVLQVDFDALEQLTGKQYPSIDRLADNMPIKSPEPVSRQAWVDMASTQNLALRAARAAIDLARENVNVAQAGHLPSLEAIASYSHGGTSRLPGFNGYNSIGLQASIPIYTGGATSAQVQENTDKLEAAQFSAIEQLRTSVQQVSAYFARSNYDVDTVEADRRAVESNRVSLQATREGYAAGTRTILDVLNAQQNYYNALSDLATARYTYVLDMLQLRQEAGVLDLGTLQSLNRWLVHDDTPVRLDGKGIQPIGNANININNLGH